MLNFQTLSIILTIYVTSLSGHPDVAASTTTAATTTAATTVKINSVGGFTVVSARDGLTKRGAQDSQITESVATGKSYDPPPEFYRAPGTSTSASSYNIRDPQAAIASKTIAFPINRGQANYEQDDRNYFISNWRQPTASEAGGNPVQDRISVGHYTSHGQGGAAGGNNNYAYEAQQYATKSAVGAGSHSAEYNLQPAHYGGGGGVDSLYYNSAEGIPFDLYSHNGNNKGNYAGAGGEYSYTQYPVHEPYEHPVQKGHPGHDYSKKALLAKSFLIPLASAAVLGIAAALVSNPLLLQLGTVSGVAHTLAGKRKRRALRVTSITEEGEEKKQLAYRGHHDEDGLS